MNFLNFGMSVQAWAELFGIVIIIGLGFCMLRIIYNISQTKPRQNKQRKRLIRKMWIMGGVFIIVAWGLLFAFGPGKPITDYEESGALKLTDNYETETRTETEIKQDAYNKKEESLQAQDTQTDVDDYIKKQLED